MRFKKSFVALTIVTVLVFFILFSNIDFRRKYYRKVEYQAEDSKCGVIHVGVVCVGYGSHVNFYTLLKSVYYFRNRPLQFHILVDNVAEKIIKTLFDTWAVPQVHVNFYKVNDAIYNWQWMPEKHHPGLLKLAFPTIISVKLTNKIIVIDPDFIFAANIQQLWNLFNNFENRQFIGLPAMLSDINTSTKVRFSTSIVLYHLEHIQIKDWNKLWMETANEYTNLLDGTKLSDQNIVNEIVINNLDSVYRLPCQWDSERDTTTNSGSSCYSNNNQMNFVHSSKDLLPIVNDHSKEIRLTFIEYDGNLLRGQLDGCIENLNTTMRSVPKACISFPEAQMYKRRTLLFFREFKYTPTKYDVTFVTQLSFDKLGILDEVGQRWKGPMSLSIYLTDSELEKCIEHIENSVVLKNRLNIAYHSIFKEGNNHPINALRNIALEQVITPYVFLNDMDLVPMQDIYDNIKKYISEEKNMEKKAFVVPAFETKLSNNKIPTNKKQLLKMMDNNVISIVQHRKRPQGHGPTNYEKWRTAKAPYQVKWKPKYEPYVVVHRNVTKYDERFFAYGWDKISHIMELEAQGYKLLVLPNAFVVHKNHLKGKDKQQFVSSTKYKSCLKSLKQHSANDLKKKYGRKFHIW